MGENQNKCCEFFLISALISNEPEALLRDTHLRNVHPFCVLCLLNRVSCKVYKRLKMDLTSPQSMRFVIQVFLCQWLNECGHRISSLIKQGKLGKKQFFVHSLI